VRRRSRRLHRLPAAHERRRAPELCSLAWLSPAAGLTAAALARLGAPPGLPDRILQREALKSCLYAWLAEHVWGAPEKWLGVGRGPAWQHLLCLLALRATQVQVWERRTREHACLSTPPLQPNVAKLSVQAFRDLWERSSGGGSSDSMAALNQLGLDMSLGLGMAPPGTADLAAAMGQQAADALFVLVASAMRAWLQMSGSGQGHRITVGGASPGEAA
jgi:hypothetical protein